MERTIIVKINNDNYVAVESSKNRERLAKLSEKFRKIIERSK